MKIYTKTGDKGESSLFGGRRVRKDHLRLESYGTIDELNASIGVIRASSPGEEIDKILADLQDELFILGADLATPEAESQRSVPRISAKDAADLEAVIDTLEPKLKPLQKFIHPGGSPVAAHVHVARTICRRAERCVVRLSGQEAVSEACIVYLNRLSDLLFMLARYANHQAGVAEPEWNPPAART